MIMLVGSNCSGENRALRPLVYRMSKSNFCFFECKNNETLLSTSVLLLL